MDDVTVSAIGLSRTAGRAPHPAAPPADPGPLGDPLAGPGGEALAQRARALVEALPAVQRLRGKRVVVKVGGSVLDDPHLADAWARDMALLAHLGLRPVVVHGGGPALTRTLARLGIETRFVGGHRVTTAETAEVAEMVLSGRINKEVVARLNGEGGAGLRAVGLSGTDGGILQVRPHRPGGQDIGFVGEVESVDARALEVLLAGGFTPVLSSTATDRLGRRFNVNADRVAGAVAAALGAEKLVVLSDVPGVQVGGKRLPIAGVSHVRALLASPEVTGGMLPKLEGAVEAIEGGVHRVHLVDGRVRSALLVELFFEEGRGTLVVPDAEAPAEPALVLPPAELALVLPPAELALDLPSSVALAAGVDLPTIASKATAIAPAEASTFAPPPPGAGLPGIAGLPAIAATDATPSAGPQPVDTLAANGDRPAWAGTLAARGGAALMETYGRDPVEVVSASGSRIVASDGRTYLDFGAGVAVNALGHGHPAVAAALASASRGILHASNLYWTEPMVRLAERLTAAAGMERAFFCNSGTEAIETAIKLARKARPGRPRIAVFERSFHGRTLGALSATIQEGYQAPFRPLLPGVVPLPFGDFDAATDGIDADTAAVIVESIQGEGGVRPAPAGWLAHLRKACDRAGALLVLDEVQTGLGRTGRLFAYEEDGILPDAVAVAKALAGGLPMGTLLARGEAAGAFRPGDHGCTFGGGPFVATVAHAVLDALLAPGFLAGVRARGERVGAALGALAREHPELVLEARGRGLMWGLALREPLAKELVGELRGLGLLALTAGKDVLRILPPLTTTEAELDEGTALVARALARVASTLLAAAAAGLPAAAAAR